MEKSLYILKLKQDIIWVYMSTNTDGMPLQLPIIHTMVHTHPQNLLTQCLVIHHFKPMLQGYPNAHGYNVGNGAEHGLLPEALHPKVCITTDIPNMLSSALGCPSSEPPLHQTQ